MAPKLPPGAFKTPIVGFPQRDTSYLYELVGELKDAGGAQLSELTKLEGAGAVARKVKSYHSKGWLKEIWTNADENLVTLIAIADVIHDMRIAPLSQMNMERMLSFFEYEFLSDRRARAALHAMNVELKLIQDMRDLTDLLPALANALVSTGFFADLFNFSQNAFNERARFELSLRCERNKRQIAGIVPVLEACIAYARPGGILGRTG